MDNFAEAVWDVEIIHFLGHRVPFTKLGKTEAKSRRDIQKIPPTDTCCVNGWYINLQVTSNSSLIAQNGFTSEYRGGTLLSQFFSVY